MAEQYLGLIADVGGTNIRLQLVDLATGTRSELRKYLCANYPTIVDAIQQYLTDAGQPPVTHACIAIACPTNNDWIAMTNHSWAFSVKETQATLGWHALHLINDYTAISMSLPHLTDEQKVQVGGVEAKSGAPIAVFGPGTGLGVAHLVQHDNFWMSLPGEGGHVDFAPIDEVDAHILAFLSKKYEHVSVEQLLSGPGIVQMYQAIADMKGEAAVFTDAAEISQAGIDGSCAVAQLTMEQFCRVMGSFGGNLALNLGAFGGVFIAGGIVPRFIEFLKASEYRQRFEAKGRFREFNAGIPTFVVTEEQPGLVGAAAYLMQTV
ncbi:glucokinase [Corallincola holothuriorum]|uniref:Glucokinase n=1 Tax=Corallincola holothuriorum TaxID=2282215 RepID=A0A368NK88_9GAMM|nr:glucokinase [Corallincola holothuriorum]RCU50520.1 glucokinase [Corallincola holothuriorum]